MPYNAIEMRATLDRNFKELKEIKSYLADDKEIMMIETVVDNAKVFLDNLFSGPTAEEIAEAPEAERAEIEKMYAEMQPQMLEAFEAMNITEQFATHEKALLDSLEPLSDTKARAILTLGKIKNNFNDIVAESRNKLDAMAPKAAPAAAQP